MHHRRARSGVITIGPDFFIELDEARCHSKLDAIKAPFATSAGGALTYSTGWEATAWYAGFVIVSALSMFLLAKASKSIPIGTAYPVWTGIGAVGTVLKILS